MSAAPFPSVGGIEIYDPRGRVLVPEGARIEKLTENRFKWSEGPVWIKDGGYLLFTDVPANVIYRWTPPSARGQGGVAEFLNPSGWAGPPSEVFREPGANGLVRAPNGAVFFGDHGNRMIAALDLASKKKTPLAERFDGMRFNSPNDLALASSGAIYFTDPPYGLAGEDASPAKELPFNGVYRIAPPDASGARAVAVLDKTLTRPNGVILSPDERFLYVAVTDVRAAKIYRYSLSLDGLASARTEFADLTPYVSRDRPGLPDGMAIDTAGNVYATGPGGIRIFAPDGTMLALISTGVAAANCTFGDADGRTLYIASGAFLARVRLNATGAGF